VGEQINQTSDVRTDTGKLREHVFGERERVERLGHIRQFVFGSLDGILVPLGVVSGVAGGTGSAKAVIVAGLAEAFAGAISMGAGEFLSGRAEAQVQQAEVKNELRAIRRDPQVELREMVLLLESEGVQPSDARHIAERLQAHPQAFASTMVQKELGLELTIKTAKVREGVTMGLSYAGASVVPLISYFFLPLWSAFLLSLSLSLLFLIVVGVVRGKLAQVGVLKSAAEVVAVGAVSGLGGYLLGTWLPRLLGY